jgi:hypothetical protein
MARQSKKNLHHVYFRGDPVGTALLEAIMTSGLIASIDRYGKDRCFHPVNAGIINWSASASSQLGMLARDLVRQEQQREANRHGKSKR